MRRIGYWALVCASFVPLVLLYAVSQVGLVAGETTFRFCDWLDEMDAQTAEGE